jgi:hypothetical protein
MHHHAAPPVWPAARLAALRPWTNVAAVRRRAATYLGPGAELRPSSRSDKKYMVRPPGTRRWVHFGQMGYEDFTRHRDPARRANYLRRSANIAGDWRADKYSANNLARRLLW